MGIPSVAGKNAFFFFFFFVNAIIALEFIIFFYESPRYSFCFCQVYKSQGQSLWYHMCGLRRARLTKRKALTMPAVLQIVDFAGNHSCLG